MDSEEEASGSGEASKAESSGEDSDSEVAGIALASSPSHRSFFTTGDSDPDDDEDYGPSYCFMVKSSKVSSKRLLIILVMMIFLKMN